MKLTDYDYNFSVDIRSDVQASIYEHMPRAHRGLMNTNLSLISRYVIPIKSMIGMKAYKNENKR